MEKLFILFRYTLFPFVFTKQQKKWEKKKNYHYRTQKKIFFSFFACDKMEIYLLAEEEKIYSNVYDTLIMSLEGKINKQY